MEQTYNHPAGLSKSPIIAGLRWTTPRAPCPVDGIHGDTYPMTWADDDAIYMSSGDPNWAEIDGLPRKILWPDAAANPALYPLIGGLDLERLTGQGAEFGVEQVNSMPGFIGPGGQGAKPSGLISVDGSLYLAAQNLLGWRPSPHRPNSQHGSDAAIIRSDDHGRTWQPDLTGILTSLEATHFDRPSGRWRERHDSWQGWRPMFPGNCFGGPSFVQCGRDNADAPDDWICLLYTSPSPRDH
jgi:hypothetical protein